ncbi:hypothetical protein TNCT_291271 [Trichonephila clavata]|uniref:Uncharacterized protein n=1 Tax=Trichonephila clavata TaxID=2740835 RepID=A0A8X6FEL2_TRICU|nr:hypothetical protein TNCT_268521 [Trichonephila clavata]GFQ76799.1 hypothetical protein TNCT_291271 [Trichonephila clavata]
MIHSRLKDYHSKLTQTSRGYGVDPLFPPRCCDLSLDAFSFRYIPSLLLFLFPPLRLRTKMQGEGGKERKGRWRASGTLRGCARAKERGKIAKKRKAKAL